jgi:hypothetical protein
MAKLVLASRVAWPLGATELESEKAKKKHPSSSLNPSLQSALRVIQQREPWSSHHIKKKNRKGPKFKFMFDLNPSWSEGFSFPMVKLLLAPRITQ